MTHHGIDSLGIIVLSLINIVVVKRYAYRSIAGTTAMILFLQVPCKNYRQQGGAASSVVLPRPRSHQIQNKHNVKNEVQAK
jgi:hypothetical protein